MMLLLALALAADGPDRSTPPAVEPAALRQLPAPVWTELHPGARVGVLPVPGVRKVHVEVVLHRGQVDLPPAHPTTYRAYDELWGIATDTLDPEAVERTTERLDAALSTNVGYHHTTASVTVPRESLEEALSLLQSVLHEPRFSNREVRRWRWEEDFFWSTTVSTSPAMLVYQVNRQLWYPPGHAYRGTPGMDTLYDTRGRDLDAMHAHILSTAPIDVLVVGDVSPASMTAPIETLLQGRGTAGAMPSFLGATPPERTAAVVIDVPSSQSTVSLRMAAPPKGHEDHDGFRALDHALGGAFTSRLNGNLREERGLTYSIFSSYMYTPAAGIWSTNLTVKTEDVLEAITQIRTELASIHQEGATAREIQALSRETVRGWNDTLGTAEDAAARYGGLLQRGMDIEQGAYEVRTISALQPSETQRAAQHWFGPDNARLWVIAGPRDMLSAPLDAAGLSVTWLRPLQVLEDLSPDTLPREVTP